MKTETKSQMNKEYTYNNILKGKETDALTPKQLFINYN